MNSKEQTKSEIKNIVDQLDVFNLLRLLDFAKALKEKYYKDK